MNKLIKKLVPASVKKLARNLIMDEIKKERAVILKTIPKYDLQEKHIAHLKVIPNRAALIALLAKNGVIAEIGVNKGEFSKQIVELSSPSRFHLIDAWSTGRYHDGLQILVEGIFQHEIKEGSVVINRGYSTDVCAIFPDSYFDWIYIDTDHSYNLTKKELELYEPKMKKGGIIAGHDFVMGNWIGGIKYGVMEAVYEFCVTHQWELVYLTIESHTSPSFAIRRIDK